MSDETEAEQVADVPVADAAPETKPEAPAVQDPLTLPYPADGEAAVLYSGDKTIEREGITFAPDTITNIPIDVARKIIGRDDLRMVQELPEKWDNFLKLRARALGMRGG